MRPSSLLVLEFLLPEANNAVARRIKVNEQRLVSEADESATLKIERALANAAIELSANFDRYVAPAISTPRRIRYLAARL